MLVRRAGGQQKRLQLRVQPAVDEGHLVFHVHIRHVADAPDDDAGAVVHGEIRQQAGEQLRLHVGQVRHGGPHQQELLLRCEHLVLLFRVGTDTHADLIKNGGGPADHIQVAQGDGVEAAGADSCFHGACSSFFSFPLRR